MSLHLQIHCTEWLLIYGFQSRSLEILFRVWRLEVPFSRFLEEFVGLKKKKIFEKSWQFWVVGMDPTNKVIFVCLQENLQKFQ